ncbi:unnamed protein product [Staurois parvus]|uniref:Uncharacterized protein n=1 Tax=Staurois parvus TaxID=386267 RepID=A0ABN9G2K1_9NEOB|nr:unnamed protein product [Staurois parvus]
MSQEQRRTNHSGSQALHEGPGRVGGPISRALWCSFVWVWLEWGWGHRGPHDLQLPTALMSCQFTPA